MKANDVREHFKKVGTWVNWQGTCDQFLHGDPNVEVKGIATSWTPTNDAIRKAAERGLNLFITHEHAFCDGYKGAKSADEAIEKKKRLLDAHGMTLLRCHDTWDRMPEVGIPDAWATFLGFDTEPRPTESFYKICLIGDTTVKAAAKKVLSKVKPLGQEIVLMFGNPKKRVSRMAVGTGAVTHLPTMLELGADLLLATDDGMRWWENCGLWAHDLDVPVLVVNHATAEKPGMMAMADYLAEKLNVRAEYIDVAFPYSAV